MSNTFKVQSIIDHISYTKELKNKHVLKTCKTTIKLQVLTSIPEQEPAIKQAIVETKRNLRILDVAVGLPQL